MRAPPPPVEKTLLVGQLLPQTCLQPEQQASAMLETQHLCLFLRCSNVCLLRQGGHCQDCHGA